MLTLSKNDGTPIGSFSNDAGLYECLMVLENEKLLGCDLYLILETDFPDSGNFTPTIIKSKDGGYRLVVNTREGIKRIPDVGEIGIKDKVLDNLFEERQSEGKVFLSWDSPLLEAITSRGGHNKFCGNHLKHHWSFLAFPPNKIMELINTSLKPYNPLMLEEAWQKRLMVVEVCKGDLNGLKSMVVEPGANVAALRKEWCLDYCEAHDMRLTESD